MFESLIIKFANGLENRARRIKQSLEKRRKRSFLTEYGLTECKGDPKIDVRYNSYEGTSISLCDALISSGIIERSERIVDIGCGTGIFLLYMAKNGYLNLMGIEFDKELFEVCQKNIAQFHLKKSEPLIQVFNQNALDIQYDDKITCFYLFNTFYDKDSYSALLDRIEDSLKRHARKIKIILLFPTVASMGAVRERTWLEFKQRIISKEQNCYNCLYFLVYESKMTNESFINFENQ